MSNSRTFGLASGNHITTDLGDIPTDLTDNDFTAIVVFRRGTSGNGRGLLLCGTNTSDGECFGMWISSNERLFTNVGDGWDFHSAAVASLTETWYFGAMTVGSAVRVHLGNLEADTWGHGDTGSPIDPTTLKDIKIGNRTPSPTSFDGDIAFAAIFEEEFTDQQIEDLAAGVFASLNAGATAAWLLNQDDVGDPVLDLVGDADQSAISGTAVSAETPEADGFSYSLIPPIPENPYGRYRASELTLDDTDPVISWPDEGSGENDLDQASSSLRPLYSVDAFQGHPAVVFDGTDDCLQTDSYASALSQPNTVVIIGLDTLNDDSASRYWFDGVDATDRNAAYTSISTDDLHAWAGSAELSVRSSPAVDTPFCAVFVFDGASTTFYIDNDEGGSPATTPGAADLGGLTLARRFAHQFSSPSALVVAEVLVYDRALDSDERAALQGYYEATYPDLNGGEPGGTHYERSAGTLQFGLSLETPSRSTGFGRSAEPLQFALALGEPSRIASHQRSASPMQFELAFGSVHHGDIMFEPELEGDGSISDQIMASLTTQGFDTGSLLDRERARLLAKLSFTPVGLSNSGITYSTADLYRLAEETPRLIC